MDTLREYIELALITERIRSSQFRMRFLDRIFADETLDIEERCAAAKKYCDQHLEKLGAGSSRVTYLLTGNKVLKVAKYEKGIAQNEEEVQVYTNPKTRPIVTKIYNYNPGYGWIISELVKQAHERDFMKEFDLADGWNAYDFVFFATYSTTAGAFEKLRDLLADPTDEKAFHKIKKFVETLFNTIKENKLLPSDIENFEHWGVTTDGRLVILDYGFSKDVYYGHYATGT